MKLSEMSFFNLASQRMKWLGARQVVVSENIANANTPGYRAKEVSPFAELVEGGATSGLAVTNTGHIPGLSGSVAGVRETEDPTAWETSLDGNNVTLEQQTIKAAEVEENYRLAAKLYQKGHDMLTLAVTGMR